MCRQCTNGWRGRGEPSLKFMFWNLTGVIRIQNCPSCTRPCSKAESVHLRFGWCSLVWCTTHKGVCRASRICYCTNKDIYRLHQWALLWCIDVVGWIEIILHARMYSLAIRTVNLFTRILSTTYWPNDSVRRFSRCVFRSIRSSTQRWGQRTKEFRLMCSTLSFPTNILYSVHFWLSTRHLLETK